MLYVIKDLIYLQVFQLAGFHIYYSKKLAFISFYISFYALSYYLLSYNGYVIKMLFMKDYNALNYNIIIKVMWIACCLLGIEISLFAIQLLVLNFYDMQWWEFSIKDNIFYANSKLGSLINNKLSLQTSLFLLTQMILGPIYEEILFRRFIQRSFSNILGNTIAIICTSLIFALLHSPKQFLAVFITSIVLGFIYAKTRNILYPILLHSICNLFIWLAEGFGLLIFFTSKDPEKLSSIDTWQTEIILFLIFFPLLMFALKKLRN